MATAGNDGMPEANASRPSKLAPAPTLAALQAANASHPRPRSSSHSSHSSHSSSSSHSSHSSHSSVQARKRREAFGTSETPSVARPVWHLFAIILVVLGLFHCAGLYLFTRGFLLTRGEVTGVASCEVPTTSRASGPAPPKLDDDEALRSWDSRWEVEGECALPAAHNRLVFLIIDALRYDFIAPVPPPHADAFYHNHFTLPSSLGDSGFLAHFLSDAPTTTLQRLKGLTTGSLPTFIDAGSNFGAEEIGEDNWVAQYRRATEKTGGRFAFMGDDTWLRVYPSAFDANLTFPFDSFNVEDLHSVDAGVRSQLLPLLPTQDWKLIIAHTLGLDHVGHRHTPSHPAMTAKLQEMDALLKEVVERLPEDALLVLAGDHGMDAQGDHGGEGELEVGAGIWVYSKKGRKASKEFAGDIAALHADAEKEEKYGPPSHIPFSPLPGTLHRSVPQTDLVPSLALLLGATPPYGNLGTVIPELFSSGEDLLRALRINARQIRRYIRDEAAMRAFDAELEEHWLAALRADAAYQRAASPATRRAALVAYQRFTRLSMHRARSVWARFNAAKMIAGAASLLLSVGVAIKLIGQASDGREDEKRWTVVRLARGTLVAAGKGAAGGVVAAAAASVGLARYLEGTTWIDVLLAGATVGGQVGILATRSQAGSSESAQEVQARYTGARPPSSRSSLLKRELPLLLPILLHSTLFASNSLTVHEDSVVHALLCAILLYRAWSGWAASHRLAKSGEPGVRALGARGAVRIPVLLVLAAVAVRATHHFGVCREEQGPACERYFHLPPLSTLNSTHSYLPPLLTLLLSYLLSTTLLPRLLLRSLSPTRSDTSLARMWVSWIFRPSLMLGTGWWVVDWVGEGAAQGEGAGATVQWGKNLVGRADLALLVVVGAGVWLFAPLCLEVKDAGAAPASTEAATEGAAPRRLEVLGFSNIFGSSLLLLLSLIFSLLWLVTPPTGQISLAASFFAVLALAEAGDTERDVAATHQPTSSPSSSARAPTPLEVATLHLLGQTLFFSTGHQATFLSIQWRTAFVGTSTVSYPLSPLLVVLNSFGATALWPALGAGLLVAWNVAPRTRSSPSPQQQQQPDDQGGAGAMSILRTSLLPTLLRLSLSSLLVTTSSALFAAHFRRHLMLFKVWAPRYMLGACSLVLLDLVGVALLGVGGWGVVAGKVAGVVGCGFE